MEMNAIDRPKQQKESSFQEKAYAYRPLETSMTIRLLVINPGAWSDPLTGQLRHVDLSSPAYSGMNEATVEHHRQASLVKDNDYRLSQLVNIRPSTAPDIPNPPYQALSYVWGKPEYTQTLSTKEGVISITPSLDDALRKIRGKAHTQIIWADGICINQNDIQERGNQVRIMSSVYKKAWRVLIWLGLESSQTPFTVFHAIRSQSHSSISSGFSTLNSSCAWFGRVWVVQEAYFAKASLLLWGKEEMDFRMLCKSAKSWQYLPERMVWIAKLFAGESDELDFLEVLDCLRHLGCSDDRDRIYAILGLPYLDSTLAELVQPDYTRPLHDEYYQLACNAVNNGRVFDLLQCVSHGATLQEWPEKLPSWAPDWSKPSILSLPISSKLKTVREFSTPVVEQGTRSLFVEGVSLSKITAVSDTFQLGEDGACKGVLAVLRDMVVFWATHLKPLFGTELATRMHPELSLYEALLCGILVDDGILDHRPMICAECILQEQLFDAGFMEDHPVFGYEVVLELLGCSARSLEHLYVELGVTKDQPYESFCDIKPPAAVTLRRREITKWLSARTLRKQGDWLIEPITTVLLGRRLFLTEDCHVGLGPEAMREGDALSLLEGGECPFILRPRSGFHQLVGQAYVSRLMHKQGMFALAERWEEYQTFQIR